MNKKIFFSVLLISLFAFLFLIFRSRLFITKHTEVKQTHKEPFAILITLKNVEASTSSVLENPATPSAEQISESSIIDNEGKVISHGADELNIPKIYTYDLKIPATVLQVLTKIKTFGLDIQDARIIEDFFLINAKPKIIFRLSDSVDMQIASLQLILQNAKIETQDLEFIDLRFDKPVVRLAPKKNG